MQNIDRTDTLREEHTEYNTENTLAGSAHVLEVVRGDGSVSERFTFCGRVPLVELARREGLVIPVPCGQGYCGGCAVRLEGEVEPPDDDEQFVLEERGLEGLRLACRAVLCGDCRIWLEE